MTEYDCTVTVDDDEYSFVTSGAVTLNQAYRQLDNYLFQEHLVVLELASSATFQRISI